MRKCKMRFGEVVDGWLERRSRGIGLWLGGLGGVCEDGDIGVEIKIFREV